MGIEELESFIKTNYTNVPRKIPILSEVKEWRREHGTDPTILIDLKELNKDGVKIDEGGLFCGGRFDEVINIFQYFFTELKKSQANLVFFCLLDEGKYRDIYKYQTNGDAYDCIRYRRSLYEYLRDLRQSEDGIASILRPYERQLYNLMKIVRKYGEVVVYYGSTKSVISTYAHQNRGKVMALITGNIEYVSLDGDFEYWSTSEIDFRNITIKKFCRRALYEQLRLSTKQMQLLCALSHFDSAERKAISGTDGSFLACIAYVRGQHCGPNGYDVSKLTGKFNETQLQGVQNTLNRLTHMNNPTDSWEDDVHNDLITELILNDRDFKFVMEFCKKNIYFAYKLMNETVTVQKDLWFNTYFRKSNNSPSNTMTNFATDITLKLCGVIFKDIDPAKRPKTRTVYLVWPEADGTSEPIEKDIIYPPGSLNLPSLRDLLTEEFKERFVDERWSLFGWLLNMDAESVSNIKDNIKNDSGSNYELVFRFTVLYLFETIQLTPNICKLLSQIMSDIVPTSQTPPPMPNNYFPRYIYMDHVLMAHNFTIAFELICHCLEMCGLQEKTPLILFNAMKFHQKARENDGNSRKNTFEGFYEGWENVVFVGRANWNK